VSQAACVSEADGFLSRRAFLRMPWLIYKGDTNWVPPLLMQVKQTLDTRKNPFYRRAAIKLFIAEKDGRPAGRVAAVVNDAHNEFHGEQTGFFGFFECINDQHVADALLSAAKEWLAGRGMNNLRGPASPSTNHECALLVDGFDRPPMVMMPYNPPYYAQLLERFGLARAKDIYAYKLDADAFGPRLYRLADAFARRSKLEVRPVNVKDFASEIEVIRHVYNNAWEKNWGFVPMNDEEFDHLARDMKQILEPSMALLGFVDGRPAGFSVSLPNINEVLKALNGRLLPFGFIKLLRGMKKIRSARNLLMGVIPEFRRLGLDVLMYARTVEAVKQLGYTWGEMSWILEGNIDMRKVLEKIGAQVYKTYRFYDLPI
jgi:GNAT superfamily N-acetyltransferase